jgi:hypothetical protein
VKITESSLKRIIREELKRLAEAPEPKTLSDWYNGKGMRLPSLKARRRLAQQLGLDPKTIGTRSGNTALLNKLIQGENQKTVDLKDLAPSKPEVEGQAETLEDRVIKMLKFYDTAVYGSAFGTFISRYNGLPGAPAFIAAGPRFAGDLGMLVKMPADLSGLKTASRSSLPKTDNKFANNALEIANRLVRDNNPDLKADLADMLTKSMSGGMTLQQITDAKAYLEYLQALVKKNFASYSGDSDGKKARTKSKQQKALVKLLKQVKQRGPDASAVIMRLNEAENDSDDFDVDKQLYGGDVIPITGDTAGRNLVSGNILSKFITPNITPAKLSENLKQYNKMAVAAIIVAENLMTGASKLHDMMKKDADAAKYITQFILSN